MNFRKFIKNLSNLRDAYRVLEIMDNCGGVDISPLDDNPTRFAVRTKHYLSKRDAEDLRKITLYKEHYKNPPKWFHKLFYRDRYRWARDFYYYED